MLITNGQRRVEHNRELVQKLKLKVFISQLIKHYKKLTINQNGSNEVLNQHYQSSGKRRGRASLSTSSWNVAKIVIRIVSFGRLHSSRKHVIEPKRSCYLIKGAFERRYQGASTRSLRSNFEHKILQFMLSRLLPDGKNVFM